MRSINKDENQFPYRRMDYLLSPILRFSIFTSLVLIGYWRDLSEIWNIALTTPEAQYVLAVPPIILFLLYKKRKALCLSHQVPLINDVIGFCLCLFALMLSVWGSCAFYSLQFRLLSLPIFVAGGLILFFGFKPLHALFFPLLLLFFLIPFPSTFLTTFGGYLTISTAHAAYSILSFFKFPVELSTGPEMVLTSFTNNGQAIPLTVGVPCSGLYCTIGFVFFALIFAYLASGSLAKKTIFSALGLAFVYSLNILRVCLIVIIAHFFGASPALNFFHLFGGSLILFIGVLFLLFIGDKLSKLSILQKPVESECPICKEYQDFCRGCGRILTLPKVNIQWKHLIIISFLLLIPASLISQTSALSFLKVQNNKAGFNFDTSTGEVKNIFPKVEGWQPQFVGRDKTAQAQLGLKDVAVYTFSHETQPESLLLILEISDAQSKFHTWEGCLHYQPFEMDIQKKFYTTLYDANNSIVIAETFIVNIPSVNQTVVLMYWFDNLPFNSTGRFEVLNVKVTLLKYVSRLYDANSTNTPVNSAVEETTMLGQQIEKHWGQFKLSPKSLVVDLYNYKEILIGAISTTLAFCLGAWITRSYRERTAISKTFKEQSKKDKLLLKIIQDANHSNQIDFLTISEIYKKQAKTKMTLEKLWKKIEEFNKKGLLKKKITMKGEQLYQSYKVFQPTND